MPFFKGLAVSIHTPNGRIDEHAIQKQSRQSRISSYIPVPPAKEAHESASGKPEQSTFSISIQLLVPGQDVPYSTPKPTEEDPFPRPRVVGGLPGYGSERGSYTSTIPPYIPSTANPAETLAAYIYFDGRTKEEVATLLRRGEETWVNSRWVSVPESEGGGLAEREFLFREVGLERWLNGLDLEGSQNKTQRLARRQKKLEKKRSKRKEHQHIKMEDENDMDTAARNDDANGVSQPSMGDCSPTDRLVDDESLSSTVSDSEDEPPEPEAAGQIKVALFRVLASGEIKRGEYSPQFDAHDDDDGMGQNGNGDGDADVDHTTSFAQPKTLDPRSISTQTVTGLDPPEKPYAVFTYFYRGEKQLKKMGIIKDPEAAESPKVDRKKSTGLDFSKLAPLKSQGTIGFSGYRDPANSKKRKDKKKEADAMESDADDEDDEHLSKHREDGEMEGQNGAHLLSPEDARRQGEIEAGVQKIKLKRAHSAEPLDEPSATRRSSHIMNDDTPTVSTPQSINSTAANPGTPQSVMSPVPNDPPEAVGSPFKRPRPSIAALEAVFGQFGSGSNGTERSKEPPTSQEIKESQSQATPVSPVEAKSKQDTNDMSEEEL